MIAKVAGWPNFIAEKIYTRAKGKYILPLDADDWIRKDTIKLMVKEIQKYNCGFVFSAINLEGEKEGIYKVEVMPATINNNVNIISKYLRNDKIFLRKRTQHFQF